MGRLFLCEQQLAKKPYRIKESGWEVYSLEEICYFLLEYAGILEDSLIEEDFLVWLKEDMMCSKLAEQLKSITGTSQNPLEFYQAILESVSFCETKEMEQFCVDDMQGRKLSMVERQKKKADVMLRNEQYEKAIMTYHSILGEKEIGQMSKEFLGSIWHNLGTAHVRLFFFQKAAGCYQKAYEYLQREESKQQMLLAMELSTNRTEIRNLQETKEAEDRPKGLQNWKEEYIKYATL